MWVSGQGCSKQRKQPVQRPWGEKGLAWPPAGQPVGLEHMNEGESEEVSRGVVGTTGGLWVLF